MESLPSEIQTAIVSHLNLVDSIQCAQVCQTWNRFIPPSAASLWHNLQVTEMTMDTLDSLPIFAPYVKSCEITIRDRYLLALALDKLEGCQPRRLLLRKADIHNPAALIRSLSRITQALEELLFELATSNRFLDIVAVITACPKLRRFTYDLSIIDFEMYILNGGSSMVPEWVITPAMTFNHLQTLTLSTERFTYPLMPLLRHSPHLKCLQITTKMFLKFQEIIDVCPELEYLHVGELNATPDIGFAVDAATAETTTTTTTGLRYLSIRGGELDHNTLHFIIEQQATLVALHLETVRVVQTDWALLAQFGSDTLQTLVCDGLHGCDGDSLGSLIRQSPNLVHVRLKDIKRLTPSVWDALQHLRSLRSLEFSVRYEPTLQTEAFRNFLVAVGTSGDSHRQLHQHPPPPPLERLVLSTILPGLTIDWRIIHPVASIQTLNALAVHGVDAASPDDIQQLLQYTPQLHTLRLSYVHQLNNTVLVNTIGQLIHLHTLSLTNCTQVTDDGLLSLIDLRPSLRELHIVRCNLDNPHHVRDYAASKIAKVLVRNY